MDGWILSNWFNFLSHFVSLTRPPLPTVTHLKFSDHLLDEVVPQLHALQAGLGGGDGVENGCVYLVYILLQVKGGKLANDTLKRKQQTLHYLSRHCRFTATDVLPLQHFKAAGTKL